MSAAWEGFWEGLTANRCKGMQRNEKAQASNRPLLQRFAKESNEKQRLAKNLKTAGSNPLGVRVPRPPLNAGTVFTDPASSRQARPSLTASSPPPSAAAISRQPSDVSLQPSAENRTGRPAPERANNRRRAEGLSPPRLTCIANWLRVLAHLIPSYARPWAESSAAVLAVGVEPTRAFAQWCARPSRLPVSPRQHPSRRQNPSSLNGTKDGGSHALFPNRSAKMTSPKRRRITGL